MYKVMTRFSIPTHCPEEIAKNTLHKCLIEEKPVEEIFQKISQNEASIYEQTTQGQSSLFLAIAKKNETITKRLLEIYEKDFEVLKTNGYTNNTAVLIAFGADDVKFVDEKLAKLSADQSSDEKVLILIKETNESAARVVAIAPKSEEERKIFLEIVEKLHRNGTFDVDSKNHNDDTLFSVAAAFGSIDLLEKLLEWGARHDEPDNKGSTPFIIASIYNRLETVKWFQKKFEIDITKFLMEGEALFDLVKSNSFMFFEFFISEVKKTGGDEQIKSIFSRKEKFFGYNVMMLALSYGHSEFAKKCLKFEPNLDFRSESGSNILHFAFNCGSLIDYELRKIFLRIKPDLFVKENFYHNTPLHLLVEQNFLDEVKEIYAKFPEYKKFFFKKVSDLSTTSDDNTWEKTYGHTLLIYIVNRGCLKITEFILENHPEDFPDSAYITDLVISSQRTEQPRKFLQALKKLKHFDLNNPRSANDQDLFNALEWPYLDLYDFLLESCPNRDLKNVIDSHFKRNLLYCAICDCAVDVKPLKLYDCCSSDDEDEKKESVDDHVREFPSAPQPDAEEQKLRMWKIFKDLIKRGVDIKHKDQKGNSLMHTAVTNNNLEVIQELLKLGLPLDDMNEDGEIPLYYVR